MNPDDLLVDQLKLAVQSTRMPEIKMPQFERPQFVKNAEQGIASEFHKRLVKWITEFDNSLDNDHEVAVRLVSFGQTLVFHLQGMGYWNPFLISFWGVTDDGQDVQLIQHVNQISILLLKVPRKDLDKPKRPIGFHNPVDE